MEATGLGPHDTRVPKSLVYHQPNAFWELLFLTSLFSANAEGSDSKSQNPLGLGRRARIPSFGVTGVTAHPIQCAKVIKTSQLSANRV